HDGPEPGTQAPVVVLQVSTPLHAFRSSHATGTPTQAPARHASVVVHGLASSQEPAVGAWRQPSVGWHESAVHGLASSQFIGAPDWQPPETSPVSTPLHALLSLQTTGVPVQAPLKHTSAVVHAEPSLHGLLLLAKMQPFDASH